MARVQIVSPCDLAKVKRGTYFLLDFDAYGGKKIKLTFTMKSKMKSSTRLFVVGYRLLPY